ncbi:hypothetical protein ETJ91_00250 [Bacillus albus]|uniref:CAP domain-containing protein n=1 Tax=Bacillus albus TaxID=2026189 RepID=UPI00100AAF81|nr:CAP domain-containing protein [Bacillus albus]RXJ19839.1 hypothetical protein ETJ91_00250 [Bacillus albus]
MYHFVPYYNPFDYYHEYVRQIDPEVTRMINLLNQERQKAGLNPLSINNRLTQVAQLKANDVATTGNCQHYSPTFGGDEGKMLKDAGITGVKFGWILYCGQPGTVEEAINWWMNISTTGHKQQILTPSFNYFGVATAVSQNGTRTWSVIFQEAQQAPAESTGWRSFELAPASSASTNGGISVVSRINNSMEVWWIGANGSVQGAYWYEGGQWQRYELAPAGSASPNGGIYAVSRVPNSMEVWWIGANGSVQGAYWYEGGQWQRFELAPAGSASTNGGISAVSRVPNSMEVWWIGANGSVQDAYWYEGGQWQRFELAPAGSASTNGGISAVSRVPNSMEVWWIGANGSVQDAYWYG